MSTNYSKWYEFQIEQNEAARKSHEQCMKAGTACTKYADPYDVGVLPNKFTMNNAVRYVQIVFAPKLSKKKIEDRIRSEAQEDGKFSFGVNYYKPGASSNTGNICQRKMGAAFYTRQSVESIQW